VWIPGIVVQLGKHGKFKASLKDNYGDEVSAWNIFLKCEFQFTENSWMQWEDNFDMDQYGKF
jgi:hypothetical protein